MKLNHLSRAIQLCGIIAHSCLMFLGGYKAFTLFDVKDIVTIFSLIVTVYIKLRN